MGQQEVYSLLKRHRKKWLPSKEIAKRLKVSSGSVVCSLNKLRKSDIISYKMSKVPGKNNNRKVYVYRFRK